jgi:hypothetical protein
MSVMSMSENCRTNRHAFSGDVERRWSSSNSRHSSWVPSGEEPSHEHLAVHRVRAAPAEPDDLEPRRLQLALLPGRGPPAAAPSERTEEDEVADTLRVAHRVGHGYRPSLGDAQQGEAIEAYGVDDGLEVAHPRLEREVRDVPVGQSAAALVVTDEPMAA